MNGKGVGMLQFARLEWFWMLALVPVLATVSLIARRRRVSDWKRLGQAGRPRSTGSALWIGAFVCLVFALAQPRWGVADGDVRGAGSDIVLAIDLSRSMGAEDALPNRLGLAVEAARSLIEALGGEQEVHRVAVVGFAGRGVLRCPLTENLGAAIESIEALRVGEIEPNGTNLGAALDVALDIFDDQADSSRGSIVLFTDGEDHDETWSGRIENLKSRGLVVHAVAIGDADEGHVVPDSKSEAADSEIRPLTYQGATVLSKRRDEPLAALAESTGGALIRLGISTADLGTLYRSRIEPIEFDKRSFTKAKRLPERFGPFLLVAFCLILAANGNGGKRVSPRRYLPRLSILLLVVSGAAPLATTVKEAVDRGAAAYAGGRFDQALAGFREARRLEPMNPVVLFDEAAALFQLRRFDEAYSLYEAAREKADPTLKTKIDFALGNTAVSLQQLDAAVSHYDDCIASKSEGDRLNQVRDDALLNKRFVEAQTQRTPAMDQLPSSSETNPPTEPAPKQDKSRSSAEKGSPPPGGGDLAPNRAESTGGGAGSGVEPQPTTVENQLAEAVDNIKKARSHRIDESSPNSSSQDRKDW